MKAKIDLEKFICSMFNDSKTNAGYVHAKSIERALKEQGMEYKDGEIVEIEQEQPSEKDYEDLSIINEGDDGVLLYFTKDGRGISDFRISKDTARWLHSRLEEYLEMYDAEEPIEQDSFETELNALLKKYEHLPKYELADSLEFYLWVVGKQSTKERLMEGAKPETKAIKEHIENLKKRIEDNQLGCIVQRLDKIIELLQSAILILPKEPYVPPIIYKRPLDPDPNVLGGWTTTASTIKNYKKTYEPPEIIWQTQL